ncbi:hypothetical protein ACLOJK_014923 [Asimina triloba]
MILAFVLLAPRRRPSHVVRPAAVLNHAEYERAPGSPIHLSDSSKEAPLEGDGAATPSRSPARGFDEVPVEATPAIDIAEEQLLRLCLRFGALVAEGVQGVSQVGSTGSGGEVSIITGRAGVALISELVSVVPVAHNPGSFSHINLPLLTVSDLLFSGGGVDDLNVDNVDRPLELPGADALIIFGSFFALASPGHVERSPSSVHQAGSSGEGGSNSKGADDVLGRAAEPVALVKGGVVKAVVPDSDKGSSGNSSVG